MTAWFSLDRMTDLLLGLQHELLLFSAVWFLVGAIDDLAVDLLWGIRHLYRRVRRYSVRPPMRANELPAPQYPGMMAIFVASWREGAVLEAMLQRCRQSWSGGATSYRIYAGCYPNDPGSVIAIRRAARNDPNIRLVLCKHPGPTTKADCLNRLWQALLHDELAGGYKAKAVILHDAEDSVHQDALHLFDYLVEKAAAVQLPVIPVCVPSSRWISGHYQDEFAEAHGKSLVVREALGASLPLAGVGCALERNLLGRIALARNGSPFDPESLTEDYELGLGIGQLGGKTIFARILDDQRQLVGTRACFPDTLAAAVRQKCRWTIGIALAGWDRLGWRGGPSELWMRLRDRKAVFAAIVLAAAYAAIILTAGLIFARAAGAPVAIKLDPVLRILLVANAVLLVWRLAIRALFVGQAYGWQEALRSVPRSIIANIIAIMAARRACWTYLLHICGQRLVWDKTEHVHFPQERHRHA